MTGFSCHDRALKSDPRFSADAHQFDFLYSCRFLSCSTIQVSICDQVFLVFGYVVHQECSRSRNLGFSRKSYRRGEFAVDKYLALVPEQSMNRPRWIGQVSTGFRRHHSNLNFPLQLGRSYHRRRYVPCFSPFWRIHWSL